MVLAVADLLSFDTLAAGLAGVLFLEVAVAVRRLVAPISTVRLAVAERVLPDAVAVVARELSHVAANTKAAALLVLSLAAVKLSVTPLVFRNAGAIETLELVRPANVSPVGTPLLV